jgi:glycosyltransferase involved in cell wall biosynthesis
MRICFVLEHFYPHIGGAETIFQGFVSNLARLGHQVRVITSNSGGLDGKQFYGGVEVFHFRWREFFGHPIPSQTNLDPFIEWADLVHTATYTAGPVALAAAKRLNKPCVITVYESLNKKWFWIEPNPLKAMMFWAFERYVVSRSYSLYHAISDATATDLKEAGVNPDAITIIYPGVNEASVTAGISPGKPTQLPVELFANSKVFLYFGRPGQTKGIFVLFEAIRQIAHRLPEEIKFAFILSNDPWREKQRLRMETARARLESRVRILDPVPRDDLTDAIKRAYCVVIPSITEGFGFSAAESCALGAPVIASNAGSLPEVVSGKALFFENRNTKSLAEQILKAVEGNFEAIPAKDFDWGIATARLVEAYETLTCANPSTA